MWEHSPKGGCWFIKYKRGEDINLHWENLLLGCIGEQFEDMNVIGAVISLKPRETVLAVWLKDGKDEGKRTNISLRMASILLVNPTETQIFYKDHHKSILDNSTIKNSDGYTFIRKSPNETFSYY